MSGEGSGMTIRPAGDVFEQEAYKLSLIVNGARKAKTKDIVQHQHPEGAVVQRALAGRVFKIFGAGGRMWNGIATSCHFATIYWIILEVTNRTPTTADFQNKIVNPSGVIKSMVHNGGVRINQPGGGGELTFTPGSVIVFMRNNEPAHSCVATSATKVAGYNQQGWFTAGGLDHDYSSHKTNQFKAWGGIFNRNKIRGYLANAYYELFAVSEGWAQATINTKLL